MNELTPAPKIAAKEYKRVSPVIDSSMRDGTILNNPKTKDHASVTKMKPLLLFLTASLCYAGQGFVVRANETLYNNSIPALPFGSPYRIEMSLQNLTCNWHALTANIASLGVFVSCPSGSGIVSLGIYPNADAGAPCGISAPSSAGFVSGFVTFRFQHIPGTGGGGTDTCQGWDVNGNQLASVTSPYTAETNTHTNGVTIGDQWNMDGNVVNYLRVYSSTVPSASRPPITADSVDSTRVFEWKFDGNLNDSGPGGYTVSLMTNWSAGGAKSFVSTLGQSLVVALAANTNTSPSWPAPIPGYQASWRAGQPGGLSCASSYSQSDDPGISCFWQVLLQPGQVAPVWSSQTSQTPTLMGLVFGDYAIQLTVTDQIGNSATSVTHIGAVATDSNGVVVNANPAADAILGPMIAFGQNPWGIGDYWHLAGSIERESEYISAGLSPTWPYATWEVMQAGNVSYTWLGTGMAPTYFGGTPALLTAPCSITATSCTISNAAPLQLAALPARIYISSAASNRGNPQFEEIRVCSVSGTSPATLTFCYDGRGYADPSNGTRLAAQNWNTGAVVGNDPIIGTGTAFTSTLCPAGAPGPFGVLTYSTGTVALTAGSTVVTLTGGGWTAATVAGGYYLIVSATHSSSNFKFISPISSLTDATHLVLTRSFPADADTASGLTYSIVQPNLFIDVGYTVAQGLDPAVPFMKYWNTSYGCESDTLAYFLPVWDPGSSNPVSTAQPYTYQIGNWWYNQSSTGGLDFYSEDLANLAGWLRSGLKQFHDSSMMIGDIWIRQPQKANGGGGSLLYYGGPVIGGVANAMLSDTGHGTQWKDIRSFALGAVTSYPGVASANNDCNNDDSREKGYQGAFLALAAEFDPDLTSSYAPGGISWRRYWQNELVQYAANESACANQFGNTDNSWRFTGGMPGTQAANAVTLTTGSATGTGAGLVNNFCFGIGQASNVTVTSGSAVVTGSGFPTTGWNRVAITGPGLVGRNGNSVPTLWVYATPSSSTQFTISFGATWPGTTSNIASVMFDNGSALGGYIDGATSFMSFEADPMSQYAWSCIYNSGSSVTLNRPWTGSTGVNYAYTSNVTGFNILPYMLGIRQYALWQAQNASSGSLAATFESLRYKAGIYEHNVYDPGAGANYYAIQPACDPITLASMGNTVCYSGYPPTGLPGANYSYTAERVNTIENSMSLSDYYLSQGGSPSAIAWGDLMYGNCMGNPSFTTGGVHVATDGNTCDSGAGNLNAGRSFGIGAGKWYGFFFGMGASWRWPAQRLGGVQAAQPRAVFVGFDVGSVPSAASVQIVVTAPSGAQTSYACSDSPCQVTVDDRQGSHLYRMSYLSRSGEVLARSQSALLD
ncbi:MAG: hypothetical protein WBL61_05465 [Bryobacteraceae bacterium]